jgi:uncharacterized membrane protein
VPFLVYPIELFGYSGMTKIPHQFRHHDEKLRKAVARAFGGTGSVRRARTMYLTLSGCLLIFALAMVLLGEWLWGIYVGVVAALTTVSAFKIGRLSETSMETETRQNSIRPNGATLVRPCLDVGNEERRVREGKCSLVF